MKKFCFLLMISISNFIFSQTTNTTKLSIKESIEYTDDVMTSDVLTIHSNEKFQTVLARGGRKVILFDVFDENMNKTATKKIEISKNEEFVGDLFVNDQLKLFTVDAPKPKERVVYCHTFDVNTGEHRKKMIFQLEVEKNTSLFSPRKTHQTNFALSPNGEYFAIATDDIAKDRVAYTIRVFDSKNENNVYTKTFQNDLDKRYVYNDLYVDNEANAYCLGRLFLDYTQNDKVKGQANYQFILYKVSKDQVDNLVIDLEGEHILSLRFSQLEQKMFLYGFYSEKNIIGVKGSCNFEVDMQQLKVINKKKHLLPKEVFEDLYGEKRGARKKEKEEELKHFYIDYILHDKKGNTFLVAEEFYITSRYIQTGASPGMGYYESIYHYDDIIIMKFNTEGDLTWGRSIFKRALSPNYGAFVKNNELHIILNSGKNLLEKNDGRTKVSQGVFESSSLYDIEFSENGEIFYNKIHDNKNLFNYVPANGCFESDRFIMMSGHPKKKRFMILE